MIAKVQPGKRKSRSSFKRLLNYLTTERDATTGETRLRGDVVLSGNLVGIDTASAEMTALEFFNPRCHDAVFHYELAWPPGERPSRGEWTDAALHTLKQLGFNEHLYVIAAHDNNKHFHIHVMVNKIHPITYRSHTPPFSWLTLDAAARFLEAKHGWKHTPGPTQWDEQSQQAVRISQSEHNALHSERQYPTGTCAPFEHYKDQESFKSYVRREIGPSVRKLLTRKNVTWEDLHRLLSNAHLRLEKGEMGGYTVLDIAHNIRLKASHVFRDNFAGRINRQATEVALGPWTPASTRLFVDDQHTLRTPVRDGALREERREQRRAERVSLMQDYNQYRDRQRELCKGLTAEGREASQRIALNLRQRKKQIRTMTAPWSARKILLSHATAQSVIEMRILKAAVQLRRREQFPKDLRSWVAERAGEGDGRAAAQLRGWRYADQRNQRRLDARLETSAVHFGPTCEHNQESNWAYFAQLKEQNVTQQIAATRVWTIDRRTGDVSYLLNGAVSVIDRGRLVTVLNQNEAAIIFGLEMAVRKYGVRIACTGTEEWKRAVTRAAVQYGIFVQFTDLDMQRRLDWERQMANPLQLRATQLHLLETRLRTDEDNELLFNDETEVLELLSCIQPAAHAERMLTVLKGSEAVEAGANVAGKLTVSILKSSREQPAFKVSVHEGKRQEIIDRVVQRRQSALWSVRRNIRTDTHAIEGR